MWGGSTLKKVTSVMDINSWDISGSDYDTRSYTVTLTGTGQYLYLIRAKRSNGYGGHEVVAWSGCTNVIQFNTQAMEMSGEYFDVFLGLFSNPSNPTLTFRVGSTFTRIDIDIFKLE